MRLVSSGREYATWPVSGADAASTLEVSFDGGDSWRPLTQPEPGKVRALVAGPDATDNPTETVVLNHGRNPVLIRLTDTPEIVVRAAGVIDVYTPR